MKKYFVNFIIIISIFYIFNPFNVYIDNYRKNTTTHTSIKSSYTFDFNITLISDGQNNIYWNEGYNQVPKMAIDSSGNIHVIWNDNTEGIWGGGLDEEIMYAFYNRSIGWSNATVISDGFGGTYWNNYISDNPEIAIDTLDNVHVVWQDNTDGLWGTNIEIMYASYNRSIGWSNATIISDGYNDFYWNDDMNTSPSIAIDSLNNIHVVWQGQQEGLWGTDQEIMYVVYNQSIGWSNVTVISDDITHWNNDDSLTPTIAIDTLDNVHIVWQDNTDGLWGTDREIMYCNFTQDIGWSNVTIISDDETYWNNGDSDLPKIAIDSNDIIHVVWQDSTQGIWGSDMEIMYISYNQSIGWSNITIISDDLTHWNDGLSFRSDIYIDFQNNLHIVWVDGTDGLWGTDQEIMYISFLQDSGWSNITIISDGFYNIYWNNDDSTNPSIIVDDIGNVHIIWEESTNGPWTDDAFDTEIFYISMIMEFDLPIDPTFYYYLLISILLLGIIALILYYEDKKKKSSLESISLRKEIIYHISKISLAISVIFLQTNHIEYNSKKYIPISLNNLIFHIFPIILLIVSLLILVLLLISVISTIEEYKTHLRSKRNQVIVGHRINFDQIFENKNRSRIIRAILENPSIHFNELLRECNLTRGQLQWHLKILLEFGIIKKEKIGQFMTYNPFFKDLESNYINKKLAKSEMCMEIWEMIMDSPGIIQSEIAKKLTLDPSTVNYHIKKLKKAKLIVMNYHGRNSYIYPKKE